MFKRWFPILALIAFAAALWLASTFFFLGDTGKHSDDYWVAMRSMATGEIDWSRHPWTRWRYFWRPLHLGHCSAINTISWNHPWIGHLELALAHAGVAWMLTGLIARLGVRRHIAWLVGLLFMTCPLNAEAALWPSASCNAISSLFVLRTLELVRRQGVGPATWLRDLWIGLLAFVAACWYEPAAAALAAAPLVFLASCRIDATRTSRWWGVARTTMAAGLGCALYESLLVATAPKYVRGGASSFVGLEKVLSRAGTVAQGAVDATIGGRGWDVIAGSIEHGWSVLTHTPAGIAFLAIVPLLAVGAYLTIRKLATIVEPVSSPAVATPPPRTGWLMLSGLAIYACAWLPIIAIDGQRVELRTLYVPMLGAAFIVAAVVDRIVRRLAIAPNRMIHAGFASAGAIALAAAIAGSIGMIGFQAQFQGNARIDRRTVEQLAALLPNPAPGTIFLPLRIDARGANTGRDRYDHAIHGAFETPYCCGAIVQWVFRRTDILGAPTPWWMRDLTADGFRGLGGAPPIPWEKCVPFVVAPDGTVRLIRIMMADPGDAPAMRIEFPRVPIAASEGPTPTIWLRKVEHAHCHAELRTGDASPP